MQYLLTFLEGIISFISPCMLPLLPIYISYFAGTKNQKQYTLLRTIFFVMGFSLIFILMGLFAGSIGKLLIKYNTLLNIICGIIIIFFGLTYLDVFKMPFLKGMKSIQMSENLISAFIFGIIYSISLTPCTGAFLGSALMMASSSGSTLKGAVLLLCYSLGLGIPFILSALLLNYFKNTFDFIKEHYKIINIIAGCFLIIIGILMASGLLNKLMALFS